MTQDPLKLYPRPPFPEQPQSFPGKTPRMEPAPDHGEKSYKGSGRLAGKVALVDFGFHPLVKLGGPVVGRRIAHHELGHALAQVTRHPSPSLRL